MRFLALAMACAVFLSACETIKGAGRDIENAGEALDDGLSK